MTKGEGCMKEVAKRIGSMLGIVVAGVLLGALLLTLVFCIPVNQENADRSRTSLDEEGWYPSATQLCSSLDTYFHSYLPGVLDGGTDGLMISLATEELQGSPLYAAMNMEGYTYYWHGYVVILRILLQFMDYEKIRFLNCVAQLLLIFFIAHQIWIKKGSRYALAVLSSYFLLMPMAMVLSLQFTWVFYIAMLPTAYVCYYTPRVTEQKIPFMFLGIDMLTSFLDLLTYPLYTWAFSLLIVLLLSEDGQKAAKYVKTVIISGLSWILGYGGMWTGKWLLASAVVKRNVVQEAWDEILLRSGSEEALTVFDRLNALYKNWKHYEYPLYMAILLIWLLWFGYKSIASATKAEKQEKNAAYLLITLSAFVWYFVLANHTLGHHFFTYRIWGVAISSVLFIFCGSITVRQEKSNRKLCLYSLCEWGILCVLAMGLTLTARENITALNGNVEYQEAELAEGMRMEEEFYPTYTRIKEFSMGIRTESNAGHCMLEICHDGEPLYRMELPLADIPENSYISLPVNWKFKKGEKYEIVAYTEGNESPVYLRFTSDNVNPMRELGTAYIGEQKISGQLISGITYISRPPQKTTLFFLTISWLGLLAALWLEGKQIVMWILQRFKSKAGSV